MYHCSKGSANTRRGCLQCTSNSRSTHAIQKISEGDSKPKDEYESNQSLHFRHQCKNTRQQKVPVHIHTHALYLSIHTTKRSLRNKTSVFEDNGSNTISTSHIPQKFYLRKTRQIRKGVNCHLFKTFSQMRQG